MASHHGNEGYVKIGANVIGEIQEWSFEESISPPEKHSMGDTHVSYQGGAPIRAQGSLSCWWDETDATGQELLLVGQEVSLVLAGEGDATGDVTYNGTALITNRGIQSQKEGIVTLSVQFNVQGALTRTVVA